MILFIELRGQFYGHALDDNFYGHASLLHIQGIEQDVNETHGFALKGDKCDFCHKLNPLATN